MLKSGDIADLWHQGTKQFYRATIIQPVTPEEACGPEDDEDEEGESHVRS